MRMRSVDRNANGSSDFETRGFTRDRPRPSIPHSAFRIPHYSYPPIREQHTAARMGLRISLVGIRRSVQRTR